MRISKENNFERELPCGYKLALNINAKDVKLGIAFTVISLIIFAITLTVAIMPLYLSDKTITYIPENSLLLIWIIIPAMLGYIVLHEIVHGIAYKTMTGEKLTFGISWSCAFCGVPKIFTYRKTAIIAVVSPFAVFSLILLIAMSVLFFVNIVYYLMIALIFALHLSGCCGDLYVLFLLTVKFKNKKTLVRDTGPEQFFYVPDKDN